MSKTSVWILGLSAGALLIAGALLYLLLVPATVEPTSTSGNPFPTDVEGTGTNSDGSLVVEKSFLDNGVTIPDRANPGTYLLAGSLAYCPEDLERCEATSATAYSIWYDKTKNFFTVSLVEEPIGRSRREAEAFLAETLGISSNELCGLNYYVGTGYWVNERYAGVNLGFSVCQGATPLPN